ncbi:MULTISPECIES: cell division protein ZapC [Vibrio]|uniref:Cell division protein ZapC n=1 Tax=Vibrio halioticoli NBRC 102217 TaxID=1219072 RepID=V5FNC9_9VIBR|nr:MULTISPECIES: cell division protein ZapC [Vibrio]MPW35742.1 cell division protein ZapC [Vibrio sp. B1Z05]GAD90332.1 cell division protein ZapC [Vibrio halioticoli NBRC 102217]
MLKLNDTWNWYYDEEQSSLMLEISEEMVFRSNLPRKVLIESAFKPQKFSVEDADIYHVFQDSVKGLPLSIPRQAELVLKAVAVKRFHKPVQPKSWFFDTQSNGYQPQEGEVVELQNEYNTGYFMVVESSDTASIVVSVNSDDFYLSGSKHLSFCQPIKVMHDRMRSANALFFQAQIQMVS